MRAEPPQDRAQDSSLPLDGGGYRCGNQLSATLAVSSEQGQERGWDYEGYGATSSSGQIHIAHPQPSVQWLRCFGV